MAPAVFLTSSLALHGRAGAWDEIGLAAGGLLVLGALAYVIWRSRTFEPVLEEAPADTGSDDGHGLQDDEPSVV
jgi:uncharacterized iron-regulated membrane protein